MIKTVLFSSSESRFDPKSNVFISIGMGKFDNGDRNCSLTSVYLGQVNKKWELVSRPPSTTTKFFKNN